MAFMSFRPGRAGSIRAPGKKHPGRASAILFLAFLFPVLGSASVSGQRLAPPDATRIVVIDPGHGGPDSGLVGALGVQEKDVALAFSQLLQSLIQERWGTRALLTRVSDVSVPDALRVARANQEKAALFLGVHLGSSGLRRGMRLLYPLFPAEDRSSDGTAGQRGSPSSALRVLLWDQFPTSGTLQESRRLAFETGRRLEENQVTLIGVQGIPLSGFRGLTAPGFLLELGQIPNAEEEKRLKDLGNLARMAQALLAALEQSWWVPGQKTP